MTESGDRGGNGRGCIRAILWLVLVAIVIFGALAAWIAYASRAADKHAREFCGTIPIGSDISAATAKADKEGIFWGPKGWEQKMGMGRQPEGVLYSFYFFHLFEFDKTVCEVSVSKKGRGISKNVEVEID
jgi:hypothetical protein